MLNPVKETEPEDAYNIWAQYYDSQQGNLMLDLDEELFSSLIKNVSTEGKVIADVGCGTGRHWAKLYDKKPLRLIGYDVSDGMLNILKEKFPNAETHKLVTNSLNELKDNTCDLLISTLALAHIKDMKDALIEWKRVLKPGGSILITDYHPEALAKGGNRTFMHNGKQVSVINYIHPLKELFAVAEQLHFEISHPTERKIDDSMKHYYEKQDAVHVFERFKGTPIIYGVIFTTPYAAA